MALATTCPQCGTSFKVVPDQLERRRGLVRCGVCKHVFSGIDYLRHFDDSGESRPVAAAPGQPAAPDEALPNEAAAQRDASQRQTIGPAPAGPETGDASPPPATSADAGSMRDKRLHPPRLGAEDIVPPDLPRGADEKTAGTAGLAAARRPAAGAALFPPPGAGEWDPLEALNAPPPPAHSGGPVIASRDDADAGSLAGTLAVGLPSRRPGEKHRGERHSAFGSEPSSTWGKDAEPPGPDEDEERNAVFARPGVRYAVIALLLLAVLQLMLMFRDEIATRLPALRPVADVVAGAFGISPGTIRRIASLSIESTELQPTGSGGQATLHALLRNKDSRTVRWPAIELTLTEQAGAVVVRKVILPSDYLPANAPRDGLRARSEWPVRIGFDPGGLPLAGYSVALFYP